jgi:hypothetical protein
LNQTQIAGKHNGVLTCNNPQGKKTNNTPSAGNLIFQTQKQLEFGIQK